MLADWLVQAEVAGLLSCGAAGVAESAESAPARGVVVVEASFDEVALAQWPVVCVLAGSGACGVRVAALGAAGADADGIAGQDCRPEAGLVFSSVSALSCRAAPLFCLAPMVVALAATVAELGAAGYGADSPACTSGHGHHLRG